MQNVHVKVFSLMSEENETRFFVQYEPCERERGLNKCI